MDNRQTTLGFRKITDRLREHFSPDEILHWWACEHPDLDHKPPVTVFNEPEGVQRIHAVIDQMKKS